MKEKFKKKFINICTLGFLLILSVLLATDHANATTGGIPFSVEPVLPPNQDENIDNYISITTKDNSLKQELEFKLSNTTNEKQIINIEILNAYTSSSGVIQYKTDGTNDNKIINEKYEIKQYIEAPNKVELQGGESKIVRLKLDSNNMKGTLLGAVGFETEGNPKKSAADGISFEIKNEIKTVFGIAVNFPGDKVYDVQFGESYFETMPSYYVVRLPVTLNSPNLLKDVDINYDVEFQGEKIFFSKQKINFAPMTTTNFALPFEYKEIEQNKSYTLKGKVSYVDQNGERQVEEFEQDLIYKNEKDQSSNSFITELKQPIEKGGSFFYWVSLGVLISLIVSFILILFYRKKKKGGWNKADRKVS